MNIFKKIKNWYNKEEVVFPNGSTIRFGDVKEFEPIKGEWTVANTGTEWALPEDKLQGLPPSSDFAMNLRIAFNLMTMIEEAPKLNSGVMIKDGTVWHNLN